MKFYQHSLLLLSSFALIFVWQNSQLAQYTVPFIGFLVFMFLIISIRNKQNLNLGGPVNFFILNTVLLLFIFSTGGITSNLFFILYFLLFAAAFILDPRSVFIFPVATIIIFWNQIFQGDTGANIIKMASLSILSPLAYFFGAAFRKNEEDEDEIIKAKERSADSADEISKDVKEVIEEGKEKLDQKQIENLKDVLDETESLREEK